LRLVQIVLAVVALVFGVVTIVAGGRVLVGADPGYVVFMPLLIYNTCMGVAYVGAGVIAWRNPKQGGYAAGGIFVVNLLVLGVIGALYATGGAVALESIRAMTLRTVVWLVLFLGLVWVNYRSTRAG
jgi:hypothetical protein